MLIAIIILAYFFLTFLATIIFLGIEVGLHADEWFFVALFAFCPIIWLIGKLIYKIKKVVEHKRIVKLRKEKGLPLDGSYPLSFSICGDEDKDDED